MANSRSSGEYKEYAVVDTAPGAGGYFTNVVSPRKDKISKLYFSIREFSEDPSAGSVMTVNLQFQCAGDGAWTDYGNGGTAFVIGDRVLIEDVGPAVTWRAGVKQGGFTSGSLAFGFDW